MSTTVRPNWGDQSFDDVRAVHDAVIPLLGYSLDDDDNNNQKAFNYRKRRLFWRCFVLFTGLFLFIVAISIIQLGVLNQYVYYAFQKRYFPNITYSTGQTQKAYCRAKTNASSNTEDEIRNKVQVAASSFMVYASLALFIPPIFGNFFFMTLSDSYGRKPFILLPLFGSLLKSALFVVGIYYELDIYWFLSFLFIEGATGGMFCQLTAAFSYIADVTERGDKRIFLMVIAKIMTAFGGLLGTLSSGYLIRAFRFTIPSFVATMCVLLSIFVLTVFLPESLPAKFKSRSKNINCFKKFKGVWEFYTRNKYGEGTQWRYVCSILILICVQIGVHGRTNVETLYQLNEPFCWSSVLLGWFMSVRILSSYIIGLVLIRVLQCCFSMEFIALIGAASHVTAFILESFAEDNFELFLVPIVGFGSAMVSPIMKGFMSKMTPPDKQGTLFAGIGMADSACSIMGSTVGSAIYSATVSDMRGFVFMAFAGISFVGLILLIVLWIAGMVGRSTTVGYQREEEVLIERKEED